MVFQNLVNIHEVKIEVKLYITLKYNHLGRSWVTSNKKWRAPFKEEANQQ